MKRVIAICCILILNACATNETKDSAKMTQALKGNSGLDEVYMNRVENQASQRGVIVKWINPPKAPKAKKDGQ